MSVVVNPFHRCLAGQWSMLFHEHDECYYVKGLYKSPAKKMLRVYYYFREYKGLSLGCPIDHLINVWTMEWATP